MQKNQSCFSNNRKIRSSENWSYPSIIFLVRNSFIEVLMIIVELFSSRVRLSTLANQFFLHSHAKTHHQPTISTMPSRLFVDFTVATLLTSEAILRDRQTNGSRCWSRGANTYEVCQRISTKEDLATHASDRTKIVTSCRCSANDTD